MPEIELTYEYQFKKFNYPKRVDLLVYEYIEMDQTQKDFEKVYNETISNGRNIDVNRTE